MPQSSFYLSDVERSKLFMFITTMDGKFIADKPRNTSNIEFVNNNKEFLQIIENECVGFFITSPTFTIQPLLSQQNRYIAEPTFTISQRYGGPYIAISLYRGFAKDDPINYKRTDIFHYPRYINLNNYNEEIAVSNELKQYYKQIVDYLKNRCKSVTIGSKKYLISSDLNASQLISNNS